MRKPGIDENNVQMTDVLCDFCQREWAEDIPMIEGHQGSCICGNCLTLAYSQVVLHGQDSDSSGDEKDWQCPLCLETSEDRKALDRADEQCWHSPIRAEAVVCRRCIKLAAGALHSNSDEEWKKPTL